MPRSEFVHAWVVPSDIAEARWRPMHDEMIRVLRAAAGQLLESVHLFDVYRGTGISEGARSLAYRLRFCSAERTLTDEEVGVLRAGCIEAVAQEFGAVLR